MKITVSGGFAEKLLALRHLLLPYIKEENSVKEPILGVLKLWGLNIKDTKAISDLLDIDSSKVEDLLKEAKENELIKDNQLTKKGKKLLDEDGDLLEKLEV